jgi:hypothetical protein
MLEGRKLYKFGKLCHSYIVIIQVLSAANMNRTAFWVIMPSGLLEVYQCFRGVYFTHHYHHPHDRGNTYLWNVGLLNETTWRYIPESCHPHSYFFQPCLSTIYFLFLNTDVRLPPQSTKWPLPKGFSQHNSLSPIGVQSTGRRILLSRYSDTARWPARAYQ